MSVKWRWNEKVEFELPEASLKAFDDLMSDPFFAIFIPKDEKLIEAMREKFKKDFELEQ